MSVISLVGGAVAFETGAALVDTLDPDLLDQDPYYLDTLIQCIQLVVLSYEVGYVLQAVMPKIVSGSELFIAGFGASFFVAAAVAYIVLPFVQNYLSHQPDLVEILGDTEDVEVMWASAPSHERNQTLYLTQFISSLAAFYFSGSPFFLILAAAHYLSFDLVKNRLDLCFLWEGETEEPYQYGKMPDYVIAYYVPLYREIPLLLQWFGGAKGNTICPVSQEELKPEERPTIYTYGGLQVYTDALVKHFKDQQEHLLDGWSWRIDHTVTYSDFGRHDHFFVDVTLQEENKLRCPGDEKSLGHLELTGLTLFRGEIRTAPLAHVTWISATNKPEKEVIL